MREREKGKREFDRPGQGRGFLGVYILNAKNMWFSNQTKTFLEFPSNVQKRYQNPKTKKIIFFTMIRML